MQRRGAGPERPALPPPLTDLLIPHKRPRETTGKKAQPHRSLVSCEMRRCRTQHPPLCHRSTHKLPPFSTGAHISFHPLPQEHTKASPLCHKRTYNLPPFFTGANTCFHPLPQEQVQAFNLCHRNNHKLSTLPQEPSQTFNLCHRGTHTSFNLSFGLDTDSTDHRQQRQNLNTD